MIVHLKELTIIVKTFNKILFMAQFDSIIHSYLLCGRPSCSFPALALMAELRKGSDGQPLLDKKRPIIETQWSKREARERIIPHEGGAAVFLSGRN